MPVKTIQFIYTTHNKIQNYDMINNQIVKVYIKPNNTIVMN